MECEKGHIATREGSFESGVDGAQPGVIMPADPKEGLTYRQESFPGHAEDRAEIFSLDEMAEVPFGHFPDTLMIKETTRSSRRSKSSSSTHRESAPSKRSLSRVEPTAKSCSAFTTTARSR